MTRPEPTSRFSGFPPDAVDFYRRLGHDNTKAFWTANRETYDRCVRGPFEALAAELGEEFGTFHLFRPNRDVRFSKDKSPYKDHQGAVTEGEGGEMYYVAISADGLFAGSGYHQMARDQLDRFRTAVADDCSGDDLVQRVGALERRFDIGGRELATAPRGYPRDHPRIRFLQHKGLTIGKQFGTPAWLATGQAKRRVVDVWRAAAPVHQWLNAHVGPSELAPED